MTKVLSILFLVLCFSDGASAQVTASRYRRLTASCVSYAHGYMDGISGMRVGTDDGIVSTLNFDHMTTSQVIRVVVAYIDRHPEILHNPIREVFLDAVVDAKLFVYTKEKQQQRGCRDDVKLVVPTDKLK